MNTNAFINKPEHPTDADLAAALGPAKPAWDQLLADLSQEHGVDAHEWKCYSPKWGWSLRATRKKRTIVWLAPLTESFEVVFILGEKAMIEARQTKLLPRGVKALNAAPKYPEGSGVRFKITSSRDIGTLKKLAAIKIAN